MSKAAILSPSPLSEWCGDMTAFRGAYSARPGYRLNGESWPVIENYVAPGDGPQVLEEKERGVFVLPCLLRVAPLTGNTLKAAQLAGEPLEGEMRSAAHVTEARMAIVECDGANPGDFEAVIGALTHAGVTFITFSTHSHGREDRPGVRARFVVPIDYPVDATGYRAVVRGLIREFFSSPSLAADGSSASLCQMQGVWAAHPKRQRGAFRQRHRGGVLSTEALMEKGRDRKDTAYPKVPLVNEANGGGGRIESAAPWLGAEGYQEWIRQGMALKVLSSAIGEPQARRIWFELSARASDAARARDAEPAYDISLMWERFSPTQLTPETAIGVLLGAARDNAASIARNLFSSPPAEPTPRLVEAVRYLARFHNRVLQEMRP